MMDIVVYRSGKPWATPIEAAFIDGLIKRGLKPEIREIGNWRVSDVAVIWGHRDPDLHRMQLESGNHYLVLERGHLQDRRVYTSMGWDGLGRQGRYPTALDGGERWNRLFGHMLAPWTPYTGDMALIFGQVIGDASLVGVDFHAWVQEAVDKAKEAYGLPVIFRPHPRSAGLGDDWTPDGCAVSDKPLQFDLNRTAVAITFNSTSGIEAVLDGVPTVCCDPGAMAWPVAAHDIGMTITPDRTEWMHDLAWSNWTNEEISNGIAWDAVRGVMEN